MPAVDLEELANAATVVEDGEGATHALVSRETGIVHILNDDYMDEEAPVPADANGEDEYVPVPAAAALGLGDALVFRFAAGHLPGDEGTVRELFRDNDNDGFARLLEERGATGAWQDFRTQQTRSVLGRWCEEHGLQLGA
jgi:hypothetical protein